MTSSTSQSESGFANSYAVVIGINDYHSGVPSLRTAVNDAQKIAEILESEHKYTLISPSKSASQIENKAWLDENATLENLNALLKTLKETVGSDDRLLFYFAGHGTAINSEDGPQGYLIPQDAKYKDITTYLSMSQLRKALAKLSCRHCLIILDCCYSGAFQWSNTRQFGHVREIFKDNFDLFINDRAWQVITSSAHDQTAADEMKLENNRDFENEQHSPFAIALMEALRDEAADTYPPAKDDKPAGDGIITADELYQYVRYQIELETAKRNKRQTPGLWIVDEKHDKGVYVFLTKHFDKTKLPPAPTLEDTKESNPYRGLESYEEEHSQLFFGRTKLIEELCDRVCEHPLTVVLGASGSGKSSLVKAGLIPHLKRSPEEVQQSQVLVSLQDGQTHRHKHEKWKILEPIRPGESPAKTLENTLKGTNLNTIPTGTKLLLVIDQFEELVTQCREQAEREQFLQQLSEQLEKYSGRLHLILTLRSDFEPQLRASVEAELKKHKNLASLLNAQQPNQSEGVESKQQPEERIWNAARFIVPPMKREELQEVIEAPAAVKAIQFDSDKPNNRTLVQQLIHEVADMPGALPLLSFALSELYRKLATRFINAMNKDEIPDRTITWADYNELGGVTQSVTKKANEVYQSLLENNPKEKDAYARTIRNVMLRMISLEGGEIARRKLVKLEWTYADPDENNRADNVINRFVFERLLVKYTIPDPLQLANTNEVECVEPAHDALVRGWDKLQKWQQEEQEALPLQRRLTPAAIEWKSKQEARFLWNADPYLDVLKQVFTSEKNNWFNNIEAEFVRCSIQRRERNRRIRGGLIATAFFFVSGVAFIQWKQNQEAQSINFAASSKTRFASDQQLDALVDVIKSGKTLERVIGADAETTQNVIAALLQTLYNVKERNRLQGHQAEVSEFSFSPDGNTLIAKDVNGAIQYLSLEGKEILAPNDNNSFRLLPCSSYTGGSSYSPNRQIKASWDYEGFIRLLYLDNQRQWQEIWKVQAHRGGNDGAIYCVHFSPDGQMFASVSSDKTMKLWSVEGKAIKRFQAHNSKINSVRFSPDGKSLASAGDEGIKIWSLEGKELKTFQGGSSDSKRISSISFSPDGKTLASATDTGNKSITLWSLEGKEPKTLDVKNGTNDVSFSPDGKMLASASNDGSIKFWSPDGHSTRPSISANKNLVNSVSFSPDGNMLVSSGKDGSIKLWNLNKSGNPLDKEIEPAILGPSLFQKVRFSPDGKMLAVENGRDGKIKLLSIIDRRVLRSFDGNTVSFSPDGKMLAFGSKEGNIKLWTIDGEELATLRGHNSAVSSLSFSPNGKKLASSSDDGTIALWDLDVDELLAQACDWARDYLKNSPTINADDRQLCDNIRPSTPPQQTTITNSSAPSIVQPSAQNAPSPTPSANNRQDTASSSAPGNAPAPPQNVPSPTPASNNGQNSYEQALSDRRRARELNPTAVNAHINQGLSYHRQRNYQQAISSYSKAIALNPNSAKAYSNRAVAYIEQKDYQKAIADSNKVIGLMPTYVNAYINRGLAYYYQGKYQQAIADYTKAIKLDPGNALAYTNRALAYTRLGDQQAAQANQRKAEELSRRQSQ
jgi:WD40 repeat protein/tetratricopeptide (TPR) repeat protein/uncharacterized caspase-like protein